MSLSRGYLVEVVVKEVRGFCSIGYKPGDRFIIEKYYIRSNQEKPICLHALSSMLTLITPFLKGVSARDLGIGSEDNVGYVQCPDPGKPYTCGGTVVFELKRTNLK
ncbi:MAG: hypothetical protein B7O98_08050 [Zestosphaera tikiterensis]|uniref:TIGR04076 family protein n=1 Tax=Zestosphaera tikiterensis TaxID=1973259 RepID=A0A2R7Y332_9CREN|nr:MAG: hypothetical protein B7O98_08050 [Zestosphaera tikiterensis]